MCLIGRYICKKGGHALKINKLLKYILDTKKETIIFMLFILSNIFSLILVFRSSPFMLSLGFLKTVFVGFSQLIIPIVYLLTLAAIVYYVRQRDFYKSLFVKLIVFLSLCISLLVTASYFYFNYQDLVKYQNFTFSTYYIYVPSLKFYAYVQILGFVVGFVSFSIANFDKWKKSMIFNNFFFVIFVALISLILMNIVFDIPVHLKDEIFIYHVYIKDKDKKYVPDFDSFSRELNFIRSNTSPKAMIIHPTQSNEFPLIGNQPLIRHGLFPRQLVSSKFAINFINTNKNLNEDTYYIISKYVDKKLNKEIVFPPYSVETSDIMVMSIDGEVTKIYNRDYSPEMINSLGSFSIGLIKIK